MLPTYRHAVKHHACTWPMSACMSCVSDTHLTCHLLRQNGMAATAATCEQAAQWWRVIIALCMRLQYCAACKDAHYSGDLADLRIAVHVLVVVEGLCQSHVLVHEHDREDLPWPVCLVPIGFVKVQAGMEAHFTCITKHLQKQVSCMKLLSVYMTIGH